MLDLLGFDDALGGRGPVVLVCGRRLLGDEQLRAAGIDAAYALLDLEPDVEVCLAAPARPLEQLGERIAPDHLDQVF